MEYIAQFISKHAAFFDAYGNWILIPVMMLAIAIDWNLSKKTFSPTYKKWLLRTPLSLVSIAAGILIVLTNFALRPMVASVARVQNTLGERIDDFQFINVRNDSSYHISDFQGKVVLLNFWGTYCKPCIEEFPDLKKIESDLPDEVTVIALSDESAEKINRFLDRVEGPDVVGYFESQKWIDLQTFRPLTVLIDREGTVSEYILGKKDYEFFRSIIDAYK